MPPRSDRDGGFLTVQHVAAVALSLIFLTLLVNLVAFQYARGVVRTAVADGARAGARTAGDGVGICRETAETTRTDLLGGPIGAGVTFSCEAVGPVVTATADVHLVPWLPVIPAWTFQESATAVTELGP